ncbi:MAG TPA: bifunctional transaldolase/phosoglucose isomerase [Bryobacteraceae bacterium]|nr:bifunctional transaldolase/phosoglucose isomerase [Bryobacteraceae bacterium]
MSLVKELLKYGQSVWLDYIRRGLITSGELRRYIDDDGLRGMTSNPAIFEKAITGSSDYADVLTKLAREKVTDPTAMYERLAIADIQDAADILRPVYDQTRAGDGYVSLEVSPYLGRNTQGTIEEARRLWKLVARPNVMIKVPGTAEGVPAVRQLISEGINVNITLLFAIEMYAQVAEAFVAGLEDRAKKGGDISRVASVASFFVSRIDSAIDPVLAAKPGGEALLGKVAVANAKLAYQRYKEMIKGQRWQAVEGDGALRQRLLWASTSTKNPKYNDLLYVEELIGRETVNTMPVATIDAFRDHGRPRNGIEQDLEAAYDVIESLAKLGISLEAVTTQLVSDGLKLFSEAFDKLLNALDTRCKVGFKPKLTGQTYKLPEKIAPRVKAAIEDWQVAGKVRRLWSRDASLWTGTDESSWLGWLAITEDQIAHAHHLESIASEIKQSGFRDALLLGMGGSSLAPEVMSETFGQNDGFPRMHVLDSTDPARIRMIESQIDPAKTLFIVSSKSGGTLEPNIFQQYFFERAGRDGSRFIAITDPGSKMQQVAESQKFRQVFFGWPSIGGRYSALSDFGMVPSAVMGVDVAKFLDRTEEMVHASTSCVAADHNPGVILGAILGTLAGQGRDKVTIIASPAIYDLGAWLEQLLAESTGKEGKGLIPVDREPLGDPSVYGQDRVFVYERFTPEPDAKQDAALEQIEKAGHPVVRIAVDDRYDIGQEFFRWEIATAVAGSILGINAFNQPDVEASKVATRKLTSEYEKTGSLPAETPVMEDGGLRLYTDAENARKIGAAAGKERTLVGYLRAHLNSLGAGDYFALLAYIEMSQANEDALGKMRIAVRDKKKVATCLGFGPRFLHSTGQAYKGGPNTGVFLQITCDDANDLPVPGQKYTFGVVKAAQARGDFEVLAERKRRALRVHLGPDVRRGLATLGDAMAKALR